MRAVVVQAVWLYGTAVCTCCSTMNQKPKLPLTAGMSTLWHVNIIALSVPGDKHAAKVQHARITWHVSRH